VVDQYTASFRGKFSVLVTESSTTSACVIEMFDAQAREMLKIGSNEVPLLKTLFDVARSAALHVDEGIDDILQELKTA
jgi:hypothetical protein